MEPRLNIMENEVGAKFTRRFANASLALLHSSLPKTTGELISLRASQINGCGWCVDIHTKELAAGGEDPARINLVAAWRESTVFTDAERAALALAEEGTRLADTSLGVSDETWAAARKHFDDDQLVALVGMVAQINAANRMSVILGMKGGGYEVGMFEQLTS